MRYEEYLEKFRHAVLNGSIPKDSILWSEIEFEEFIKPTKITPDLKDDAEFRLFYKEMYLRIRKLIENGNSPDKEKMLKELDNDYGETAKKYNLL